MLKIFLMTKNEVFFIEDWIIYHGYFFGMENIHILDASDDEKVLNIYAKYEALGLNVHYSSTGLNEAAAELTKLMHLYKGDNNFLIKLDTDEFIAYTNPFNLHTNNYLEKFLRKCSSLKHKMLSNVNKLSGKLIDFKHINKKIYMAHNLNEKLSALPKTGRKYKASLTVFSLPKRNEMMMRPCYEQTLFSSIQFIRMKSFFHSSSFISVDLGCHEGETKVNKGVIDTGMVIIHYHSTSVEDSIKRAEQVLLSHGYIDKTDDYQKQEEKLRLIRALGIVNSFHKIDLYLAYLSSLKNNEKFSPKTLNTYNPNCRKSSGEQNITVVKDTLIKIQERL